MEYKRVDCPGRVLNNHVPFDMHDYEYAQKYRFLSQYKFTIAFENQSVTGYTTEKIFHSFVAGSIPIYWGNPEVSKLFNPKSFINCHDFGSFEEVVQWVETVDNDEALFESYRRELPILPQSRLYELSSEFLSLQLQEIGGAAMAGCPVSVHPAYPVFRWSHFPGVKFRNHLEYRKQRLRKRAEELKAWMRRTPALQSRP